MELVTFPFPCPAPGAAIDWSAFDAPWIAPLAACMQDPRHHGEGDVWTHTKMVCEELVRLPGWQALAPNARQVLFAAALLHDVAKPPCTQVEGEQIRHPHHSPRGAIMAREVLWEASVPFALREQVAGLIRFHQVPFYLLERQDPRRTALLLSTVTRCDYLALLAQADMRGRIAADVPRILENIALFEEFCREEGCLDRPWPFPSGLSRFLYFRTPGRDPAYEAYDDTRCEVVLMSGLPGSGKDHWVRENLDLPEISLDAIRAELKAPPTGNQGPVIGLAKERAREYLRRGEPFVWNATNLSRELRGRLIDLFTEYRARVRIVYVEVSRRRLLEQNRRRAAALPESSVFNMLRTWEVPDRTEAQRVDWIIRE